MNIIEPQHEKYFKKFGVTYGSTIDYEKENRRPKARCTVCILRYGDAEKTDNLVLETRYGTTYLCCKIHRRNRRD